MHRLRKIDHCAPMLLGLLFVFYLGGCAVPPPPQAPAPAQYPGDEAETHPAKVVDSGWLDEPGQDIQLDATHSAIVIKVFRAGRLAHLGHNHLLEVVELSGRLRLLEDGGAVARLAFRPDRLRVDDATARAAAGAEFASIPDAMAVAGTKRNLLGDKVLDAVIWPEIVVQGRLNHVDSNTSQARLFLLVRGVGLSVDTPVRIEHRDDRLAVSGRLPLRQSALGMMPFSVFGGALSVADELVIEFRIEGRNTRAAL